MPQRNHLHPHDQVATPARRAAHTVLMRALEPDAPGADLLLEEALRRKEASPADAALAREILYGVLRRRRWLEKLLAGYVQQSLDEFAPAVHEALLIGIYQHAFMDRIPVHAIVDETVRLVAAQPKGDRFRALANAVMRRVTARPPEALRPPDGIDWRVRLSMPEETVAVLADALPAEEVEPFFAASNEPAPLCLRPAGEARRDPEAWRQRAEEEARALDPQATARPGRLLPGCLLLEGRGLAPEKMPLFREGLAAVEDEGAQAAGVLAAAGLSGKIKVLDLCAAPGGKTSHLADLLPEAEIVAADVSTEKLERLRANMKRLRLHERVRAVLAEQALAEAKRGSFALVLVDAPCSGLGTMRRHPEIRYRRGRRQIAELAVKQETLLRKVAPLVAPGGRIAYTICTPTREEGDAVVQRFLAAEPAFALDAPGEGEPMAELWHEGLWRTWTHRHGCDSFTVARLVRRPAA